jgi:hypothetical protein
LLHGFQRRVFVEGHHQRHRFQRRQHRHAVVAGVDGAVIALAQTLDRRIVLAATTSEAPGAGLGQVGHVAAMQDVEHAIGHHHRLGQLGHALLEFVAGAEFGFEVGHRGVLGWNGVAADEKSRNLGCGLRLYCP